MKNTDLSNALHEISVSVRSRIVELGIDEVLDFPTRNLYRNGFERISVKKEFLEPWRDRCDVDRMAVEIITVKDLTTEVHYHDNAHAIITILGENEGFPEPHGSFYVLGQKDVQIPAASGITLDVSPGMIHGFGCPNGSNPLTFLSVQSKKIELDFVVV